MPELWPHCPTEVQERLRFATDVRQTPDGEYRDSLHSGVQEWRHSFAVRASPARRPTR